MSICSVNGHIFCKLVLVAEAMSLVADLAMPVEINVVSWGRLHAMCYPLTCDSIFLGVIYVMLWPAPPPRYAYQHGQYSLMVVILPVWTPWSDSALCSVYHQLPEGLETSMWNIMERGAESAAVSLSCSLVSTSAAKSKVRICLQQFPPVSAEQALAEDKWLLLSSAASLAYGEKDCVWVLFLSPQRGKKWFLRSVCSVSKPVLWHSTQSWLFVLGFTTATVYPTS